MSASKSTGKAKKKNDDDDLASYLASFKTSLDTKSIKTRSSAWLKKASVEELDLHKLNAVSGRSSPSTDSSSDGVTSDLEDYMNEIDQIGDNHSRNKHSKDVALTKSDKNNMNTVSEEEDSSLSDSSNVISNMHGKVFTFEDLEHQQLTSDSSDLSDTDSDNDLISNVHMVQDIQRNDSITSSKSESFSIEEEESESNSITSNIDSSNDTSSYQANPMTNVHIISELDDSVTESINHPSSMTIPTTTACESHVTLVASDDEYSMEYDTDISEGSEEDKENVQFGTESTPSTQKRQPGRLLKEQSCQTTPHALPYPPPLSHLSTPLPHPLLPYTISPEELEVLTTYSPATVALHDLVKSQVELTKKLIDQSRALSDHVTGSVTPTYQYVTLDQTKEFIATHKPKVMSYQEALRRVKKDSK